MLPEKLLDVLKHEGVVAIVSQGEKSPHLINTWNSYVTISDNDELLIPAGGMKVTEKNIALNCEIQLSIGSREVEGLNGPGTGFWVLGKAEFLKTGTWFDSMKEKFPWIRAVLRVTIQSVRQKI